MNKRGMQNFIRDYARKAAKNAYHGVINRDMALGQLHMLNQLALVGIHDRAYAARCLQIGQEIRDGRRLEGMKLADEGWVLKKEMRYIIKRKNGMYLLANGGHTSNPLEAGIFATEKDAKWYAEDDGDVFKIDENDQVMSVEYAEPQGDKGAAL